LWKSKKLLEWLQTAIFYISEVNLNSQTRPILLCVPIYFDDGYYPSAGSHRGQRLIYWQSIAVLCATIRRSKPPLVDVLICTNETPPPDISRILDEFGVKFANPDFSFRPPTGLFSAFTGAFYLFDSIDYCRRTYANETIFTFIDPDCIVMKGLDGLRQYISQRSIIGYQLDLEKEKKENGCSRNDLLAFLRGMVPSYPLKPPAYFGGEFLMVSGEQLPDLCETIDRIWKRNLQAFEAGDNTLKTEEHVLSVAFALSEERVGTANDFVKRMWTRPSSRNVSPADTKYWIWHLPAEKRHAFPALFRRLEKDTESLIGLNDDDFREMVSRQVRLKLSFLEKLVYFVYPQLKILAGSVVSTRLRMRRSRKPVWPPRLRGTHAQLSPLKTDGGQVEQTAPFNPFTAVVVATKDRPLAVSRLLDTLKHQTVRPDVIIISAYNDGDVEGDHTSADNVQVLFGPPGLPAQRNRALALLRGKADIVIFFDDDFVPSRFWIERVQALLKSHPDVGGVTGQVLADGVKSMEIAWAEAQSIVDEADQSGTHISWDDVSIPDFHMSPYGCNMAFRAKAIQDIEFDERLVLYGWLEDRDFGARAARRARMIFTDLLWGVHLGVRSGRTSGLRFGYSQVVNPWYLKQNGSMKSIEVYGYIIRALARNALGIVFRTSEIDRWGRFKGNLIGLTDILHGRWAPERIAHL
jgi:GT2 family glycosyltransferase